jgi:alpha-1,3/alpha-1,6-mannosyltransferase
MRGFGQATEMPLLQEQSHKIAVNSRFTAGVFKEAFSSQVDPEILYPGIRLSAYDTIVSKEDPSVAPLVK